MELPQDYKSSGSERNFLKFKIMHKFVCFLFLALFSSCVQNKNEEITESINETFKAIDENIKIADSLKYGRPNPENVVQDYSFKPSENNISPMSDELSNAYDSDKK